jgi:hypothetical protein
MSAKRKALMVIFLAIFGLALFGNHLNLEYRSLIASTQKAKPLLDEDTLAKYSHQITEELNKRDVSFAIISRAGQARKRLPEGVQYTHSAYWVRNETGNYDVYNLYHGEENRRVSSLVADAAADFIKPTRAHDFGVIIPASIFQQAMKAHILSPQYGRTHNPAYSLISNPFDTGYQNCNEFVLDEMASLIWDEADLAKLKQRLAKTLIPTEIKAGFVRRYIAPFVDERLVMKDHEDVIATTTRQDLIEFLETQDLLDEAYRLDFKTMTVDDL